MIHADKPVSKEPDNLDSSPPDSLFENQFAKEPSEGMQLMIFVFSS